MPATTARRASRSRRLVWDAAFSVQSRVHHDEFGDGTVTDVEEDRVTVLFEEVGYRTLSLELVEEHGLLTDAG